MSGHLTVIPTRAVTDRDLGSGPLRVLLAMGGHTDKSGWCRLKQATIAHELGITRTAVTHHVGELIERGYVQAVRTGRSSSYRVLLDAPEPEVSTCSELTSAEPSMCAQLTSDVSPELTSDVSPELTSTERQSLTLEKAAPRSELSSAAKRATDAFWEATNPKPVASYIAIRKLVEAALKGGSSEEEVGQALPRCKAFSAAWLDGALRDIRAEANRLHLTMYGDPNDMGPSETYS